MTTEPEKNEIEKIDPEALTESLNGFDQIAIKNTFGAMLSELDGTMSLYAVLFVHFRRVENLKDKDAFNRSMNLSMKDISETVITEQSASDDEKKEPEIDEQ